MTERFTEKMITRMENLCNQRLKELGFKLQLTRNVWTPDRERRHEIVAEHSNHTQHQLAYYHQNTYNTYVTLKSLYEIINLLAIEMQELDKQFLSVFQITDNDISTCLENVETSELTQDERQTIAAKAMDYITEDMHKAIADAFDNYIPDTRKEELTK